MIAVIHFFVRASLAVAGRDIDGEVICDVFEVIAEAADGRRWAYAEATFPNRSYSEEGSAECGEPVFVWDQDAEAKAEALAGELATSRWEIDPAKWVAIEAAYGSASHDESALYDEDDIGAMREAR
jgi:hypothetical protein